MTETGFVAWLNARPIAKQFLKFCVVGGTSTVIDVGLHYMLMFMNFGGQSLSVAVGEWWSQLVGTGAIDPDKAQKLAVPILKIPTASLAIVNSFVLNRYWTFKIRDKEERGVQFARFVVVSVIGMLLNVAAVGLFANIVPGHPKRSWAIATLIATAIVAIWNFNGQRLWAFKRR